MKKAIVIGATSGIGKQLAMLLANQNYVTGITGRRKHLLEELQLLRPDNFIASEFDITDTLIVTEKLNELVAQLGGLDLLILSSGTGEINNNLDFNIEKKILDINVMGFTQVVDWATNYFQTQQQGHLAAITSVAGIRGSRQAPAYSASKAFQINYLEGLRQKITKLNLPVFITDIRPGFVDTQMAKGDGKFWVSTVEKAAKQIMHSIDRRRSVVYITKRWRLVAILMKLLPEKLYRRI